MNTVYSRQNTEENIERLMAQRILYSNVKFINHVNFFFSVLMPILITLSKDYIITVFPGIENDILQYFSYYGIGILIFTIITNGYISITKKNAAKIQEAFDCDVLDIPWNELKCGDKANHRIIVKAAEKYKEKYNIDILKNWYISQEYRLTPLKMTILCQNENTEWDLSQRVVVGYIIKAIISISTVSLLFYGIYNGVKLSDFLFYIVFLLPLIRHIYLTLKDNKDTIERITRLNAFICKNINYLVEVKNVSDENLKYVIRTIQDEIFSHRCSGTPVPDSIHMFFKKRNEYINKKQFDYFFQKLSN